MSVETLSAFDNHSKNSNFIPRKSFESMRWALSRLRVNRFGQTVSCKWLLCRWSVRSNGTVKFFQCHAEPIEIRIEQTIQLRCPSTHCFAIIHIRRFAKCSYSIQNIQFSILYHIDWPNWSAHKVFMNWRVLLISTDKCLLTTHTRTLPFQSIFGGSVIHRTMWSA